jgi:pyruvate,water dikinase
MTTHPETIFFDDLRPSDVARVGGKLSSLGEMVQSLASVGSRVPPGFATISEAYRKFLISNGLVELIASSMVQQNAGKIPLPTAARQIRAAKQSPQ